MLNKMFANGGAYASTRKMDEANLTARSGKSRRRSRSKSKSAKRRSKSNKKKKDEESLYETRSGKHFVNPKKMEAVQNHSQERV
jgi:hypothetical protein